MTSASILKRESHYRGKAFAVEKVTFRLANGKEPTYDLVVHPGAAVVLPIDEEGNIFFVRQYRLGANEELLELPAGTLDGSEDPRECAARELREEIGMAAQQLTRIGEFWLTPGYSNEYLYIFLAQNLRPAPLEQDDDELIEIVKLPLEQAYHMASTGMIRDGKTLAALFLASAAVYQDEEESI